VKFWRILLLTLGNRLIALGDACVRQATAPVDSKALQDGGDPYRTMDTTAASTRAAPLDPFEEGIHYIQSIKKREEQTNRKFLDGLDWNALVPQFMLTMARCNADALQHHTYDQYVMVIPYDMHRYIEPKDFPIVSEEFSKMLNERGISSRTIGSGNLLFSSSDFERYLDTKSSAK
jgi:hypothetical protein